MAWKDAMIVMLNAVLKDCNLDPYLENWECATTRPSNRMGNFTSQLLTMFRILKLLKQAYIIMAKEQFCKIKNPQKL